ncbi:MAG TPA: MarR family transcriptional regulator [Anaeromyxobacteraceae bacterium]|nr:MarR family transcriptional regulator [Anaeromyxobacteraceae bacterium]
MVDERNRELDDAQENLYFAFRSLTAEPDRVLLQRGLSRVHHRILYFVRRNPGLGPGELLRILRVSRQALARPLRELSGQGLLRRESVPTNRRRKRLVLTAAGARLERRLSDLQRRRFATAFAAAGQSATAGWCRVMTLLRTADRRSAGTDLLRSHA